MKCSLSLSSLLRRTVTSSSINGNGCIKVKVPFQLCSHIYQNPGGISKMESGAESVVVLASGSTSTSDTSSSKGDDKTDHLTRTSTNTRNADIHSMKVTNIENLSQTVKEIVLTAAETPPSFTFKAGQWVDVFIPGEATVGGFSMTSSPQELSTMGTLRLAIKYSSHPPAHWMHKSCKVGNILNIRIGGDFHLSSDDLQSPSKSKILLIAGGVGINPLTSIVHSVQAGKKEGTINPHTRIYLLFSAKESSELLFKDAFESYRLSDEGFNATYFLTGRQSSSEGEDSLFFRRILVSDLVHAITWLQQPEDVPNADNIETYLCGPPSMIKSMTDAVQTLNMRKPHFEQWW